MPSFIITLLLTYTFVFAGDREVSTPLYVTGNNTLSAKWRIGETQLLLLDILKVNRQIIRSQNIQIQKLLTVLSETNKKRHRQVAAKKLIDKMESSEYEKMQQELIKLTELAGDEELPVSFRLAAVKALSENTLPNKWIDFSLDEALHFTNNRQLKLVIKTTQKKLKENYAKTGMKFSKLYSFRSLYIIKAMALIWFNIYENNPNIIRHLPQLLYSGNPNKQAIGLLVAEKIKTYYPHVINDLKADALLAENPNAASFALSPEFYQSITKINGNGVSKRNVKATPCETKFTPLEQAKYSRKIFY